MGIFGDYIETTAFKENGRLDHAAMLKKTQEYIAGGVNVICEAAFTYYGNYCTVDILRRNGDGWDIYEVKNCPEVEEQFIKDTAFQRYIAYKSGLKIKRCHIIYHGADENNPFVIKDVTARVRGYYKYVDDNIWRLGKVKFQKEEVVEPIGEHCECPYRCWYWDVCHK
ncbi:MAG: hypothetical protein LUD27_06085 [Clostridia bacterium]|nr:hypothetical protein [Clostridia bacterium]